MQKSNEAYNSRELWKFNGLSHIELKIWQYRVKLLNIKTQISYIVRPHNIIRTKYRQKQKESYLGQR
jgi:hypothetical protein